ncbi:Ser-Thr-rich glycosyl-phosphatidyl-inositol-anchored membrane family-domain-containing protein [Hypoxylon sp. NC1633]|nr:Ser-Thr-rich glycosyl-phosphatidyl-inositol-anchored membrane family-domain-containing protein [Hypoxylon sp. NC1633]
MRSTTVLASALAFAASAFAQTPGYAVLTSPTEGEKVPSGSTFTIKWEAGKFTGPATISLLGGNSPTTLVPGPNIASVDVTDGSYAWTVACSLGKEKTYGIKITSVADEKTFQYSFPFAISGPSCSSGAGSGSGSSSSSSEGGYPTSVVSSASASSSATSSASSASSATTLTSATSTITSESSTSSSSSYTTLIPTGNLSTTAVPTTIVTSATTALTTPTGSGSTTTSAPATVPTGAASSAGAGSLALVCGLAFAILAV